MTTIMETLELAVIFALCVGCIFGMAAIVTGENTATGSSIEYL